mgnify:FL=1
MKINNKKIMAWMIVFLLVIQLVLPTTTFANDEDISLKVTLSRNSTNRNQIDILATDSKYNITELKYVHKYITLEEIEYFEGNNSDVITFSITPSQRVEESFLLDGYGSYTVYAKNEHGDRFLNRITIQNPADLPQITLEQIEGNPLHLHIKASSTIGNITTIKIAKKENYSDTVDFSTQGTTISHTPSQEVDITYTELTEEGLYAVYVEDEYGNSVISQIYLASQKTPITLEVSEMDENRNIQIKVTDDISPIVSLKIAKAEDINDFTDFETKGTIIPITPGKEVTANYTVPEDGTYIIYVADEAGYQKMSQKRFTTQEKVMIVEITQDENNPAELQITATNTMANIVEMKIALGEDIDLAYFEENGENLPITEGKTVTASYTLSQNSTVNVYVKDEDGYTYLYTKTIIGIDEPLPPQAPIISLSQNETNPKQIDVVVRGLDAYIRRIKWAEGERNIAFFETNGTQIETDTIGKIIQTEFLITKTGTYTVYAIDNNGNETVETITVTNIDETPEIDREKPIITGVTEGSIYQEQVVPEVTDEHLKEIILLKDGEEIAYTNQTPITEDGNYTLTARDKAGNETTVHFSIDKTAPSITVQLSEVTEEQTVNVDITVTEQVTSIENIKMAQGRQDVSYFQNNGTDTNIPEGQKEITANTTVSENGFYTIYAKDVAGNETVKVFEVTGIDEEEPVPPEDTTPPIITMEKNLVDNGTKVEVTLTIEDNASSIEQAKIEVGRQNIDYFEEQGREIELIKQDKIATATFGILANGIYTVYAKDSVGNETVSILEVTEIQEEKPEEDTTPPTITGVEEGKTYGEKVTPSVQDANLKEVTLYKDGQIVTSYKLGASIEENGSYTIIAVDEAGNQAQVSFNIEISEENPDVPENPDEGEGDLPSDGEEPGDNHPGDGDQNPDDGNNPGQGNEEENNNQNNEQLSNEIANEVQNITNTQGNNNHTESGDNSTRPGILPQTGEGMFALGFLFVGIGVCIYFYCRYKKIGR